MEGQVVTMQDLFRFEQTGIDTDGRVLGELRTTGIRPRFAEKFEVAGHSPAGRSLRAGGVLMVFDPLAAVAAFSVMATVVVGLFAFYGERCAVVERPRAARRPDVGHARVDRGRLRRRCAHPDRAPACFAQVAPRQRSARSWRSSWNART